MSTVRFNPFGAGFTADPYPHYRELREADPVHRSFMGTWIVTRYADVNEVLRDPGYSSELGNWEGFDRRYRRRPAVSWLLTRSVLNTDEPAHTGLRKAIVQAFGPPDQDRLDAVVREALGERLCRLRGRDSFDAIADFALPVPVHTICRVFDVAAGDAARVKRWSVGVSSLIEPLPSGPVLGDAEASVEAFKAYLRARMEESGDGLPPRVRRSGRRLELRDEDLLANLVLMFPAGHETTVNLIGNGLLLLLRHPAQRRRLLEDPALWPSAIEEMLRMESPQQIAWRVTLSDRELGGRRIAAGEQLMMVLGAANRDPEAFAEPDTFDVGRSPNRHIAFGTGRHACLGAWFAKMQAARALRAMIEAFPALQLAGEPDWYPTVSFHGLRGLPVRAAT